MATRPKSLPEAREVMRAALAELNGRGEYTPCAGKPARYTDMRQNPETAAELCSGCPLILECRALGFTEGARASDMVYGGLVWIKGVPQEGSKNKNRAKGPKYR